MNADSDKTTKPDTAKARLAKNAIGPAHLVFFVVAAAAPLTVLTANAPVAISFGGVGLAAGFIVCGIVLALFAAGFTAMARYVSTAGAFYVYVTKGFNRSIGMGASWLALFGYNALQVATYAAFAVFTGQTIEKYFGISIPWWIIALIGVGLITLMGYRNITLNANTLAIFLAAEITILVIVTIAILAQGGGPDGLSLKPFEPSSLMTAGAGTMFAWAILCFVGFEATAIFAEEVRDPKRSVPRATFAAIILLVGLYAINVWAVISGYGLEEAVAVAQNNPTEMWFDSAAQYVGGWAKVVMEILVITSLLAVLLAFHNTAARYQFSFARETGMMKPLTAIHPKHRSPWKSNLTQSGLAVAVILIFALLQADPFMSYYVPVVSAGVFGLIALMAVTSLAVAVFFIRNKAPYSRLRTVVSPLLGAAGLLAFLVLAMQNVEIITGYEGWFNVLIAGAGIAIFLIGVLFSYVVKQRRPRHYQEFGTGEDPSLGAAADTEAAEPASQDA